MKVLAKTILAVALVAGGYLICYYDLLGKVIRLIQQFAEKGI